MDLLKAQGIVRVWVLMKEEYLGLRMIEQKALHLMLEEMKVLMRAVTRGVKRLSMKIIN